MRHPWTLCLFLGLLAVSVHGDAAPVRLFPGVTHAAGSAASGSTVVLNNATVMPQSILLDLLTPGSAVASASRAVVLAPGERREIADIHAFLRAAEGVGMLRVTGSVAATVRLRDQDDEPVLKELPAVNAGQAIAPNEEVDFPYSTPADMERDVQSNLILVNLDRRDVTVAISQGSITARKTIPAGAFVQIDNLGGFLGAPAGIASAHAVADGRWFGSIMTVRALATGQRRRAVAPPEELPSSFGLIDKALVAGTINAEQALTYKVFSDFGDPRLPAAFSGDDTDVTEADSPGLAAQQWATLSPATRDLIGPYLVPAFYEGSWWYLRRAGAKAIRPLEEGCKPFDSLALCKFGKEWSYVAGSHVRVWFDISQPEDMTAAKELVQVADEKIWPELIKVMGREPILVDEIGGTKLLDAVLTDNLRDGVLATTYPLSFGCMHGATYVAVLRNQGNIKYRNSAFAHELFHSVQHNYETHDCFESGYKWLMESTATWFEDELYPGVNREQVFAKKYLDYTKLSIDTTVGLSGKALTGHRYGAYVFFFYLTRIAGANPYTLVRNVWEATESADAIHALKAGLEASAFPLEESWPGFAVYSWNREAPYNLYQTIPSAGAPEGLTAKSQIMDSFDIVGETEHEVGDGGDELPHLSIRYYRVNFGGATSSSVAFYNGLKRALGREPMPNYPANYGDVYRAKAVSDPNPVKGAHVDVLVKITGQDQWKHENLTDKPFRSWCRDLKAERLESLLIILSNSDIENTLQAQQGTYRSLLYASNMGCYAWEGSADLSYLEDSGYLEKMTVSNLRLEPRPTVGDPPPDIDYLSQQNFNVVSGTFTWSASGACSSGQVSGETMVDPLNFLIMFPWVPNGGANRGILPGLAQAWLQQRMVVTTCGPPPHQVLWGAGNFFWGMLPTSSFAKLSADGKSYELDASKLRKKNLKGTWRLDAKSQ
jgi:hypothetical protein